MATALSPQSFNPQTQALYSALEAGKYILNMPLSVAILASVAASTVPMLPLIDALDPTSTDYTVALYTALVAANMALLAQQTSLVAHLTTQITTAPILVAQTITAESITLATNPALDPNYLITSGFAIVAGSLDTIFGQVQADIATLSAALLVPPIGGLYAAMITAVINDISAITSTIASAIASEVAVAASVTSIVLNFGYANCITGFATDPGFMALTKAAGTSMLNGVMPITGFVIGVDPFGSGFAIGVDGFGEGEF